LAEWLHFGDEKFQKLEEKGVQEAFVLVAGGLGERIGYDGPKVKLLHLFTLGVHQISTYESSK
jgi:UDP-N-acetylglucosamine pyrophosphorylase